MKPVRVDWPGGSRCAVVVTIDFDAESDAIREYRDKPVPISRGQYGARVGLRRIVDLLHSLDIRATFFVPGWVAEHHTALLFDLKGKGHEISSHGYLHEKLNEVSVDEERRVLERSISAIEKVTGDRPRGYRAPWGALSSHSLRLIRECGFEYDSSLMTQELPFKIDFLDGKGTIVEVPWDWMVHDWPLYEEQGKGQREVFDIWMAEFEGLYGEGTVFRLLLHPRCSGRPSRVAVLERLLTHIRRKRDVWFATAGELASFSSTSEGFPTYSIEELLPEPPASVAS
ncbi:MAG: polysaccharide deacetylase [Candidatus Geothermarchaeales archaeon]